MAGEVFGIVGRISGEQYASMCLPDSDDLETAYFVNNMFDHVREHQRWAKTESLDVVVLWPKEDVKLMDLTTEA